VDEPVLTRLTRPTLLEEPHMTEDEVHALPVVVDLPTAARALGLGRNTAYELVRSGAWPTPVLRLGRLIKVPRSSLLDLLGIPTTTERGP
jgi:predicted DNA-binding transcriptional regulator AlpA